MKKLASIPASRDSSMHASPPRAGRARDPGQDGTALAEITGWTRFRSIPAAGAQGELTGPWMVRVWEKKRGGARHKVIIPDTAHGTNPASCHAGRLRGRGPARSHQRGYLEANEIRRLLDGDVAALMVTNPNTDGDFRAGIQEIAALLHEHRRLLYLDGAT